MLKVYIAGVLTVKSDQLRSIEVLVLYPTDFPHGLAMVPLSTST